MGASRRDYEAIAELLKQYRHRADNTVSDKNYKDLVIGMAIILKRSNPAFDTNKFTEACGMEWKRIV